VPWRVFLLLARGSGITRGHAGAQSFVEDYFNRFDVVSEPVTGQVVTQVAQVTR
jgi:hypothetical protein